jgi:uncharacterized membrane protein YgcG
MPRARPVFGFVALAALSFGGPVQAQERILSYDSRVEAQQDGALLVTEHITVRAEGSQIRRGIYRDFPTRYRDRYGNRVRVGFEMLSVERDGAAEPWFTERIANGIRINTGNDDFLPVPAEYTYTLRFRTTRQLGYFDDHDELYWNAIGTGWIFPIERGTVEILLPSPVPVSDMGAEGYTGPQGAQGQAYEARLTGPGSAGYRLTAPLAPREGFTVVLTFPKGVVPEPTAGQRARWFLADNRGVLIALLGWIWLLGFAGRRWRAIGRDPRPGVVIPRYEPPAGHHPAGLRYMKRMGYDARCLSSDVLALAVAGRLRIHKEDRFLKDQWSLERLNGARSGADLAPAQSTLLGGLFRGGARVVELQSSEAATLSAARTAHQKSLDKRFHGEYFERNLKSVGIAALIAGGTTVAAFVLSGGNGIPFILLIAAGMLVSVIVFALLVRAPTRAGRALLDEIEGLALYLGVAEGDDLARMPGPDAPPLLDAERYEQLLPYAVALEVEDAWTGKFTAAVGAAAAAAAASAMTWYSGGGRVTDLGSFSRSIGSSLGSQIASSSSPPGSSSGGGGGGSSGGGGGGGGGGGR